MKDPDLGRRVVVYDLRNPNDPKIRERACEWIRALGLDPDQIVDEMPRVRDDVVEFVGLSVPDGADYDMPAIASDELVKYRFRVPLTADPEAFGLEYFRVPTAAELGSAWRP